MGVAKMLINITIMKKFLIGALALLVLGLSPACEEEPNNYDLEVIVTVQDSIRVQNALVRIFAPVENTNVDYFLKTNERGKVSVELEGKAVLDIVASKSPYLSCSFVELEPGLTTKRIDMKISNDPNNGCEDNQ